MKRLLMLVLALLLCPLHGLGEAPPALGLFLGVDDPSPAQLRQMAQFPRIAVDMDTLTEAQVQFLHEKDVEMYAYLSIGSLEKYRPWYASFREHTLRPYDNWPEEWWMDVTYAPWQAHLTDCAADLVAKGADGLFLDNGDVYYQDQRAETYDALVLILNGLHGLGKPLILNGSDVLLGRMMDEDVPLPLQGVHQESVFASIIDYGKNRFGRQPPGVTAYYLAHLTRCQAHSLSCYITEYTRDSALATQAREEAARRGFGIFVTGDVELKGSGK